MTLRPMPAHKTPTPRRAPETGGGGTAHRPVMLDRVLDRLAPRPGGVYVDGTYGGGGYSDAILESAGGVVVHAFDRDPAAIARAESTAAARDGRLVPHHARFGTMDTVLRAAGVPGVDGVCLDLGLSWDQLIDAERGFSFRADGPLDMRMDGTDAGGPTAADLVNTATEKDLADILYRYGEERRARRVARAIARERPIHGAHALAGLVRRVVPRARDGIDPATRTFQALRIWVNDEVGELRRGLAAAERILEPGGHLAVVSFHSLEDRTVKGFLRRRAGQGPRASRHSPAAVAGNNGTARAASFRLLSRRPEQPDDDAVAANPATRSARLRAAERTDAPAWPEDEPDAEGGRP